jgi:hypothetical protein
MGHHASDRDRAKDGALLREEAERRVIAFRGSWDVPGFEACVKTEIETIRRERGEQAVLDRLRGRGLL